ncbi:MAG: GNAT family N-acetyltransferase [Chloroflexota bacterium]
MQKQLANGLILRTLSEGHASDRERLPQFHADINGEGETPEAKNAFIHWVRDLINTHPTMTHDDFFVVVDPAKDDMIAAATLLIPHRWRYEDIPLVVGRPELVATHPDYRKRGLVRTLFEAVHERSAALGQQMQVITGIPYFYRQFGYTMAVDLGQHASYPLDVMADAPPDTKSAFTLRPATPEDIPNMIRWYDRMSRERLLSENRSVEEWRYEIMGRDPNSGQVMDYQMIVNAAGQAVGYLDMFGFRWDKYMINCNCYVVGEEANYLETFDDVIRALKQWAQAKFGERPPLLSFAGGLHPSVDALIDRTHGGHIHTREYMWYVRVPEMIPFLQHIQPVLERRLVDSGAHGYSGELKIGFYDLTGISFKFERGRITTIEATQGKDGYDISFPWNLFWNVVFGQHNSDEIRAILPEVGASGKGKVLIDILFPKKKSWLKGVN